MALGGLGVVAAHAVEHGAVLAGLHGAAVELHPGVARNNRNMGVYGDSAVIEHIVAAVVGIGAVANGIADHVTVVGLQIQVAIGAVGGQRRPGVRQNLGVIEIGPGVAHGQMGTAVAPQL